MFVQMLAERVISNLLSLASLAAQNWIAETFKSTIVISEMFFQNRTVFCPEALRFTIVNTFGAASLVLSLKNRYTENGARRCLHEREPIHHIPFRAWARI